MTEVHAEIYFTSEAAFRSLGLASNATDEQIRDAAHECHEAAADDGYRIMGDLPAVIRAILNGDRQV